MTGISFPNIKKINEKKNPAFNVHLFTRVIEVLC